MKCTKIWRVLRVLQNLLATWENESYNRSISFRLEKNAWIAVSKMKRNSSRLWRSKWHSRFSQTDNINSDVWYYALIRYKENWRRQIVWTRERLCCCQMPPQMTKSRKSLSLVGLLLPRNIGDCTLIVRRDDPIQNVSSVGVFAISLSFTTFRSRAWFFLFDVLKKCYQWSFVHMLIQFNAMIKNCW